MLLAEYDGLRDTFSTLIAFSRHSFSVGITADSAMTNQSHECELNLYIGALVMRSVYNPADVLSSSR